MKFSRTLSMLGLALFIGVGTIGFTGCGGPGDTPTGADNPNDENAPENATDEYNQGEENIGK